MCNEFIPDIRDDPVPSLVDAHPNAPIEDTMVKSVYLFNSLSSRYNTNLGEKRVGVFCTGKIQGDQDHAF
jgi:hypothetical protein